MNRNIIIEKNIACRVRKVRERYILVGAKKCFEINLTGKNIWDAIDGEKKVEEIINEIGKEYDEDSSVIERDVYAFLEILLSVEAISVVD